MGRDAIPSAIRRAARTPLLSQPREQLLLERIREEDDADAMAELVRAHLRLTLDVASRYSGRNVRLEDLVSEGAVGLCEAAHRFDPAHGTRFATYASWWVRAHIRSFALRNRRVVGLPATRNGRLVLGRSTRTQAELTARLGRPATTEELAEALGVTVGDVEMVHSALAGRDVSLAPREDGPALEVSATGPNPEEAVARVESDRRARDEVRRALSALDDRELEIVRRRYLDDEGQTLRAIGQQMGLSRERVRQLELRAKDKMRRELDRVA
ncbi:MAG: sigma-70 family RNA polymerase sigma factor [Sandaracinaceae bacterium]|nr:sigma-70 family RNA polymerase sigma factor [Sandaracinaceae bacterium]